GPHRWRQHSDQQARRDRASVHPRHRPAPRQGHHRPRGHRGKPSRQPADGRGDPADPRSHRPRLHRRGRPAPRDLRQHQAPDGPGLLPRPASPQGPARPRPAHPHQCADPQGPGQADRRQEEV
ncbi:MAG: SSU ribosomal protein S13p (S18e), partial [uncultured Sphingomonadaceae bacterium]